MPSDSPARYCPRCGTETDAPYCPEDGTATVVPDVKGASGGGDFKPGMIVEGRYRVIGTIGRGGFGAVYSAEHTGTGQDIALKVMLADLAEVDRSAVRRFYKEAQVTARLKHPNTVRVFDVGQTESGALYIAMEFLKGPTLEDLLRDLGAQGTAMTERRALDIAIPVLRSLGEAHALDLVHRDLKPANIILSEVIDDDPVVKVLDFGIARTADSSLTGQGTALGTPAYMSPEQCLGRKVDGRSDVYALGVILFRCLAGRVPFDDRNPLTIMYKHAHEVPPDLATVSKSNVSAGLAACVMRALAKKPEDRFANAKDMRSALEAVREGTWRAAMDGQAADRTAAMRKSVARAEPSAPPGDTVPYTGDALDDTGSIDILDAETTPANRKGGATVAYGEAENPGFSQPGPADPAAGTYDDTVALTVAPKLPQVSDTAAIALPRGDVDLADEDDDAAGVGGGPPLRAIAVATGVAVTLLLMALVWTSTLDDDSEDSRGVAASKTVTQPASAVAKPVPKPVVDGPDTQDGPDIDDSPQTPDVVSPADTAAAALVKRETPDPEPKKPAVRKASPRRKARRKRKPTRRAARTAPPPPQVRAAPPPPPPPPKPKPKPAARPVALD